MANQKDINPVKQEKITQKEFFEIILWTLKTYFRFAPFKLILMFLMQVLAEVRPIIYAALFAKVLDELIRLTTNGGNISEMYPYLIALFLYWIIFDGFVHSIQIYARRSIRMIMRSELERIMYTHLHSLGVQTLEDPEVNNIVQRANQWIYSTFDIILELVTGFAQIIRAITAGVVLIAFLPMFIPILIVLTLIKFVPDRYYTNKDFRFQVDNSEKRRMAGNYSGWLTNPNALQEIGLTGAYGYFDRKFKEFYAWYNKGILQIIRDRELVGFFLNLLDSLVSIGAYIVVIGQAIAGAITVGTATFQIRAVDSFSSALMRVLGTISFLNEYSIKMIDVVKLFKLKRAVADGHIALPRLSEPPEIEFRNVSFSYPHSKKKIFNNLSFTIKAGEKIAIVGHNGAGKTTLVKLLARIYQVSSGEILVNGMNINDLTIDDWHKNVGILFQDFNSYGHMTVRENIYIGRSVKELNEEKIVEAARSADAHDFIMEFQKQYDQILSERFEGGIRPSGGQQQKIAIARFFYRDAALAVFDEPTAAIDAVSEYNIFTRIYDFFKNKTVVIISHRFSTVRRADRIIVLEKGKIAEQGTHGELLEKDGVYAKAFKLQAEGYKVESGS